MRNKFFQIWNFLVNHKTACILLGYAIVNIFFFHSFWKEIVVDSSTTGSVWGEVMATEWNMEKVYQNLIHLQNPFAQTYDMMYPFGSNYLTTDSGNGLFFLFLRPFFSTHQSFFILSGVAIYLASVGMFLLLKKLNISTSIASLIGLFFAYMTFLQPRMGHLTYAFYYPLPFFYFFVLSSIRAKSKTIRGLYALGAGVCFSLTLYLNLYFFVILLLSLFFLATYFLLKNKSKFLKESVRNIDAIVVFCISTLFILSPWIFVFYETHTFESLPSVEGWGGAIQFSSDLFGYAIPSIYSFFLGNIATAIGNRFVFARGIFENFSYPGILILFVGSSYTFLLAVNHKRISKKIKKTVTPFYVVALSFWVLTLGPFLHVFGKWGITVDDGIRIVVPLPYILFRYLPFMGNIRSPGRLMVGVIFFAYIVVAILLNEVLKKKSSKIRTYVFVLLLAVFCIDHYFVVPTPPTHNIPREIYKIIRSDPEKSTVMEIPWVMRDGFVYLGRNSGLEFIEGQLIHQKSVIGGYMGRFPQYKLKYYMQNPLLGYIGRMIDIDLESNGLYIESERKVWEEFDLENSLKTIDFLDIKYIITNSEDPKYVQTEAFITNLGYQEMYQEQSYTLWTKKLEKQPFTQINLSDESNLLLAQGWNEHEQTYRWVGKKMSVMFKPFHNPSTLKFTASSFYRPQTVHVYMNKKLVGAIWLDTQMHSYELPLSQPSNQNIDRFTFLFESAIKPKDVLVGNTDERQLSAKFTHISIE